MIIKPILLGVNIDHVATLRQARLTRYPDPVEAVFAAENGGADGITIHLREDRRHIQDRDLRILRSTVPERLNLEMAAVGSIIDIACEVKPDQVTLVPERREELTTEGGLDVVAFEAWSSGGADGATGARGRAATFAVSARFSFGGRFAGATASICRFSAASMAVLVSGSSSQPPSIPSAWSSTPLGSPA